MMDLSIQKWGNSAAVRLPSALLDQLNVKQGDKLAVEVRADGIVLRPKRPTYALADLLAQCDAHAPMPQELSDWSDAGPVGHETW